MTAEEFLTKEKGYTPSIYNVIDYDSIMGWMEEYASTKATEKDLEISQLKIKLEIAQLKENEQYHEVIGLQDNRNVDKDIENIQFRIKELQKQLL